MFKNLLMLSAMTAGVCAMEFAAETGAVPKFQQDCAKIAKATYGVVNARFRYPEKGEPQSLNSDKWTDEREVSEFGGIRDNGFVFNVKPGILPSVALNDLLKNGGVSECRLILDFVTHYVRLRKLGDTTFDGLYENEIFNLNVRSCPLDLKIMDHSMPMVPGEFGYISNVVHYHQFHPQGSSNGENVWCVGMNANSEALYLGFGGFFGTPRTYQDIVDCLYEGAMAPIDVGLMDSSAINYLECLQKLYKENRGRWESDRAEQQAKFKAYRLMSAKEVLEELKQR